MATCRHHQINNPHAKIHLYTQAYPPASSRTFLKDGPTHTAVHQPHLSLLHRLGRRRTLSPHGSIGHILHTHLAARVAHLLDILERDLRTERLALPRLGDDAVELVDLLQGQALGLVDEEVDEGDADEAAGAPGRVRVSGLYLSEVGIAQVAYQTKKTLDCRLPYSSLTM